MSAAVVRDRRTERFVATRLEILAAAWELARVEGLVAIAMRDLGARVGMRAQSLYAYFSSKHAIYDAMFAADNRDLLVRMQAIEEAARLRPAVLRGVARRFRHRHGEHRATC